MNCPSCFHENPEGIQYCGRCRMSFTFGSLFLARSRDHLYWIIRRASAGFFSGLVAWFFIPALTRVLSKDLNSVLYFVTTGVLGGAFLGSVDGMVEESTSKTIRGAILGGIGGTLGGFIFGLMNNSLAAEQIWIGFFFFWAIAGTAIGLVSALWERRSNKIIAGAVSGFLGGGVGGALGIMMYYTLIKEYSPTNWFVVRLLEGFSGAIIGVTLWFSIGVAERFVIFKRTLLKGSDTKHCDHCNTRNPLNMWYCGSCGYVLQEAAPPGKLNLSPFITLARLKDMFNFLSRLAATTGVIGGLVVFVVLFAVNGFLAFVALLLVAVVSYSLLIFFSSLSESIQIFIKK